MKKSFFGTITVMLLLAMVLPLSVNAATLTVDKSEMNVGDVVTVEVNTKQNVESIQFDLQFDSSKYEYVNDSAVSDLDSTDSNLIAKDMVRVSAFDMNAAKADTVTMKFKAIAGGTSVPFRVVGTVEIGENGEQFDATEVQIKQINGQTEVANNPQYVDGKGNAITRLPQTGSKKTIGMYGTLGSASNIVAYALPYSDDTLSEEDIKAQFGSNVKVLDADNNGILGTGETIEINGNTYTIVIYGDVNGDGRVTTADALKTRKNDVGTETVNSVKQEALDVVKDANKDSDDKANALAQQAFILRKQYGTQEQTIIDEYPVQSGNLIGNISSTEQNTNGKRYEDITVAADVASAMGNDPITKNILTYEIKLDGTIVSKDSKIAEVNYNESSSGNFEMVLYAAKAGTYQVTPIIAGTNVNGGVQRGETYAVEVTESDEITAIRIKEGTTEVTGNAQVRVGKEKKLNVEFVHEYTNLKPGYTAPEPFVVNGVDNNKVKVTFDNTIFASETNYANNILTIKPLTTTGVKTITLEIDGISKVVNVDILQPAGIKGITLNGVKIPEEANKVGPITLYKDTTGQGRPEEINGDKYIYTIIPIELRDEEGDRIEISYRDIEASATGTANIKVYETSAAGNNMDFSIKSFYKNANGEYMLADENTTEEIQAIGISIDSFLLEDQEFWEDSKENILEGLTIEYAAVGGAKTANISVNVWENGALIDLSNDNKGQQDPEEGNDSNSSVGGDNLNKPTNPSDNIGSDNTGVNGSDQGTTGGEENNGSTSDNTSGEGDNDVDVEEPINPGESQQPGPSEEPPVAEEANSEETTEE